MSIDHGLCVFGVFRKPFLQDDRRRAFDCSLFFEFEEIKEMKEKVERDGRVLTIEHHLVVEETPKLSWRSKLGERILLGW